MSLERKLAAILAADVVGYSRLMGADEQGTLDRLRECCQTIDRLIDEHHGRFVGSAGDSVLAEFASSVDAVSCAWQIQKSLATRNESLPENQRMEYRIGVNLGDVLVDGPQIYGDGVNVAARLEGLADTGGIAISGSIYEQVHTKVDYVFDDMGLHKAKNIAEPIHVYEVRLNPDDPPPKWRKEHQSRLAAWQWVGIGASALIIFQGFIYGIWTGYTAVHNSAKLESVLEPRPLPDKLVDGAQFRSCGLCPEMTVIKQGSLLMGARIGEPGRSSKEGPQHKVAFKQPFAIGRYEVTFAQWDACVTAGSCSHEPEDRGWGRGNRPVFYVDWNDVQEYVAWLSKLTGMQYRLPSEAEWEYAARAETATNYWWGDDIGIDQASCKGCQKAANDITSPVGSFGANGFGLYDVHGNVWEWTMDCWNGSYAGAPNDGTAWTTGDCQKRVLRGGAWGVAPDRLRSAHRRSDKITLRSGKRGFRVALTLPSQ
jgi:formylglycine-generating enzyme required for sulfatase activity/class 3 adenylate cyclase